MRHEPRQVGVDLLELVFVVVEDVRHCDSSAQEGWMSPFLSASSQSKHTTKAARQKDRTFATESSTHA